MVHGQGNPVSDCRHPLCPKLGKSRCLTRLLDASGAACCAAAAAALQEHVAAVAKLRRPMRRLRRKQIATASALAERAMGCVVVQMASGGWDPSAFAALVRCSSKVGPAWHDWLRWWRDCRQRVADTMHTVSMRALIELPSRLELMAAALRTLVLFGGPGRRLLVWRADCVASATLLVAIGRSCGAVDNEAAIRDCVMPEGAADREAVNDLVRRLLNAWLRH